MQIQPAFNAGPTAGTVAASFSTEGGLGSGLGEGMRADWNVRINVSHETGFVGGAGRLLVHNLLMEEKRELTFLLPAAIVDRPGQLEMASASVCSAKPGMAAAPGQTLPFRTEGAKVVLTIPTLQINDWVYIDLTWTGGFAQGGANFPGGLVPIGEFHPQIAAQVTTDTGQQALAPVPARYDVELGADTGAIVRLDTADTTAITTHAGADGMTMHEFKSYGTPRIEAAVAPPGALAR